MRLFPLLILLPALSGCWVIETLKGNGTVYPEPEVTDTASTDSEPADSEPADSDPPDSAVPSDGDRDDDGCLDEEDLHPHDAAGDQDGDGVADDCDPCPADRLDDDRRRRHRRRRWGRFLR